MMKTRRADSPLTPLQMQRGSADDEVYDFFDRMARAITTADAPAIAALWASPALIMDDRSVQAVAEVMERARFFSAARDEYAQRGIVDTRADIVAIENLTSRIYSVDVRWPWLDEHGGEQGEELSTYLLRRDDDGELKIQAAVMRGATT